MTATEPRVFCSLICIFGLEFNSVKSQCKLLRTGGGLSDDNLCDRADHSHLNRETNRQQTQRHNVSHRHPHRQIDGINFLRRCMSQGHGAILGDDMGLGKTLQSIAFVASLRVTEPWPKSTPWPTTGPTLIVSPLSILDNWQQELRNRCPSLISCVYHGDKEERQTLQARMKRPGNAFDVLVTTPDVILKDASFFQHWSYPVLIVDEAHRLKNAESRLYKALTEDLDCGFRLLLTGTPVQNNLLELHALLHFVHPEAFPLDAAKDFAERFRNVYKRAASAQLRKDLHDLLKPHLLRRFRQEVLRSLPSKSEVMLVAPLTPLQRRIYRAIVTRDMSLFPFGGPATVAAAAAGVPQPRLDNIVIQLRKCVNHPYLFPGVEPQPFTLGQHLVDASGKLRVLDALLPFLKKGNHKVLLFSQMTRMLDILQDYLGWRGFAYERLDGSVRGEERFAAISNFGRDEEAFIFLLSTRAGGQGLNLVSADTVIIYDADWNPANDLQAIARAHRLGQTRPVKVVRLTAKNTVEEVIDRRSQLKLKLTEAAVNTSVLSGGGGAAGAGVESGSEDAEEAPSKKELLAMIKFGLKDLQGDEEEEKDTEKVDGEDGGVDGNIKLPPLPSEDDFQLMVGESKSGSWVAETAVAAASEKATAAAEARPSATFEALEREATAASKDEEEEDEDGQLPVGGLLALTLGDESEQKADSNAFEALMAKRMEKLKQLGLIHGAEGQEEEEDEEQGGGDEEGRYERRRRRRGLRDRSLTLPHTDSETADSSLTREELAARRERRQHAAQRAAETRRLNAEQRKRRKVEEEEAQRAEKAALWAEAGYVSLDVDDPEEREESEEESGRHRRSLEDYGAATLDAVLGIGEQDAEQEEEAAAESTSDGVKVKRGGLGFLVGDVTHPTHPATGPVVIVQVVDNSAHWGHGGVFSALSSLSPAVAEAYETAGAMDDLQLGACHVVPLAITRRDHSSIYVALIVAQKRGRAGVSGVLYEPLETGLRKVAGFAKSRGASIHLPRIGYGLRGFDWYAIERLLRKHFERQGVMGYIYYFKARGRVATAEDEEGDGEGGTEAAAAAAAAAAASPKPRAIVAEEEKAAEEADTGDGISTATPAKKIYDAETEEEEDSEGAEAKPRHAPPMPKRAKSAFSDLLPEVLTGVTVRFSASLGADRIKPLKRLVIALNGDCSDTAYTHFVVPDGMADEARPDVPPDTEVLTDSQFRALISKHVA